MTDKTVEYDTTYSGFPDKNEYSVCLMEKGSKKKLVSVQLSSSGSIRRPEVYDDKCDPQGILSTMKPTGIGQNKKEIVIWFSQEDEKDIKYCRVPAIVNEGMDVVEEIPKIIKGEPDETDFIFPYIHSNHMGFIYVEAENGRIKKATIRDPSGYFAQCLELYKDIVRSGIDTSEIKSTINITADTPYLREIYKTETMVTLEKVLKDFKFSSFAELKKIGDRLETDANALGITDTNLLIEDLKKGNLQGNSGICSRHSRISMSILSKYIATTNEHGYDKVVGYLDSPEFEILKAKRVTQEISRNTYELTNADARGYNPKKIILIKNLHNSPCFSWGM